MIFETYRKIKRIGDDENKDIFSNLNDEIIIQEKIDGGNFRFAVVNNQLIFGSRTQQLQESKEHKYEKNFQKCISHVKGKLSNKDLTKYNHLIFYGENCVRHTMAYNWDKIPSFLGFDIKNLQTERYLEYKEVERIYKELELDLVPLIKICKASEITEINDDLVPISEYSLESAKDQKAEGIVFKNYNKQIFAKYVRDAFKERNSVVFGGNPKYNKVDDTNNGDFVFKYCTNQRIEKLVWKKIDLGNKLGMQLMGHLIRETYLDIIEEEWKEILTSNWKLDFKNIRKSIAKRVKAVLETIIDNNNEVLKE
jgi:hypothetical protein